jgi:hypothetical protein
MLPEEYQKTMDFQLAMLCDMTNRKYEEYDVVCEDAFPDTFPMIKFYEPLQTAFAGFDSSTKTCEVNQMIDYAKTIEREIETMQNELKKELERSEKLVRQKIEGLSKNCESQSAIGNIQEMIEQIYSSGSEGADTQDLFHHVDTLKNGIELAELLYKNLYGNIYNSIQHCKCDCHQISMDVNKMAEL